MKKRISTMLVVLMGMFLLSTNNAGAQSCGGSDSCEYIIESHYGSSGGVLVTLDGGMTEEVLDSCDADNQTLKEVTCGPDGSVIIEDKFCGWGCNNGACYPIIVGGIGLPNSIVVSSSKKHLELNWADALYALGYKVTLEKESGEFILKTEV